MPRSSFIKLLIAGELTRNFVINLSGKASNNIPGGSLLYAAAGARMWNDDIGLISRAGRNYPQKWIKLAEERGLDSSGILVSSQTVDARKFYHWRDPDYCITDNPVASYARFGLTFPHELLGYSSQPTVVGEKMWSNISLRLTPTFPQEYMDITAAHLCPINLMAQIKLCNLLQRGLVNDITISPSDDYMNSEFWQQIPVVIKDISAFFPTETQITSLFHGHTKDLWEMAEGLADMGCPLIVILRGEKGYWMYNAPAKKRIVLPFYPVRWSDPTGIGDVFAGAFLGEYKNSYDPVQALISGNASASLAVEGTGAFYCLDRFPGLEKARSEVLQSMVKII